MTRDKHGYGKTGYDSHRHDPPWQQKREPPTHMCDECGRGFDRHDQRTEEVELTTLRVTKFCPHCDAVLNERTDDITESYLECWREYPDEMEGSIDRYAELREVGQA